MLLIDTCSQLNQGEKYGVKSAPKWEPPLYIKFVMELSPRSEGYIYLI